jgi:uncharacterized protein (TIGR03437 family)
MRIYIAFFVFAVRMLTAATFGTVVAVTGDPSDIVLDETRSRVYILNYTQERVDVYSTAQKRITNSFSTGTTPLAAAMSRDAKYLYITSYSGVALEIYDLDTQTLLKKVTLPAEPEGVAVGGDNRVLITTVGSSTSSSGGGTTSTSTENRMLLYDPSSSGSLSAVATTLPAPTTASIASPPTEIYQASRSRLMTSADGNYIIGLDSPSTSTGLVFVYEVASGTVLRSRTISSISSVISVAPDASRFMAGLSMFDTSTLAIYAQQNAANSLYPFASSANFSTQSNQGGSVFSPDGTVLYSAFNAAPTTSSATNSSQLMLSDPDNMLINLGIQLPENLVGKMVITANGNTIYALSQSGMLTIPVSAIYDNPVAVPETNVVLLANDQCDANSLKTAQLRVKNAGKGRMTITTTVNTGGATFTFGLGGTQGTTTTTTGDTGTAGGTTTGGTATGAGGGGQGSTIVVTLPGGTGTATIPTGTDASTASGDVATTTAQTEAVSGTAPLVSVQNLGTESVITFTYNSSSGTSLGTLLPTDFLIQSSEAINIPARVRVYQNWRNSEAAANVIAVPVSVSTAEGLVDMAMDNARKKVYIANSGMNRVEVLDTTTNTLLTPIKVGQLPRSLAMTPDGTTLYVGNSGGESISIIDLDSQAVTGSVKFPAVPYNASFSLNTPSVLAASLNGVTFMMSSGSLWKVSNGEAMPRATSTVVGSSTLTSPYNMVATPGGEYIFLVAGTGAGYLYDATKDDFVLKQTVVTSPYYGYYGPLVAGVKGQYYVVNGNVLNASLTQVSSTISTSSTASHISAQTPIAGTQFARFVQPTRTSSSATVTTSPTVEIVDGLTGSVKSSGVAAPEGPLSSQIGTTRVNMTGKQMVVDSAGTTAYLLTTSGLSIVSLSSTTSTVKPALASNALRNSADYSTSVAPGSVVMIFGTNLASAGSYSSVPLPKKLGGTCVTLNGSPLYLLASSDTQINAQLPFGLAAGKYPLVVRSLDNHVASSSQTVTVSKYAPAAYTLTDSYAALYHKNGKAVTSSNPAARDETLTMYATGLGATTGGTVTTGSASPTATLAVTGTVKVYFGNPSYTQAEVIVDQSVLAPGLIGVYQLTLRVPGFHMKGDPLAVTLKIGGVTNSSSASNAAKVAVE